MARKFGRNFRLIASDATGEAITIEPPFTLKFNVIRNTLADANTAQFQIYNLSLDRRTRLRKDLDDYNANRPILFQAGYGQQLTTAFTGNISKGFSVREGVDFITTLECYDGGFALVNSTLDQAFPKGTPQRSIIRAAIAAMQNDGVKPGAIGDFPGSILRGNVVSGNVSKTLQELTGRAFFIDNGKANCLKDNECLAGEPRLVNSASGLLATPTREFRFVNVEMLFEPQIVVGQRIRLESTTDPSFNAIYKVHSVSHQGIISSSVGGQAITTLGLYPGTFEPIRQESS